ncbi:MAG: sugar nucleotide-binding protein, partial [Paracoccaceae bacterium]|nr:sugar nucleotide-binding protein [Paracoccaceae bacterium]
MKILVVGAGGDIGKAASEALADRHEIITAGRSSGDISVDLSVPASVSAMFAKVGPHNAVVSTAGDAHFAALSE